MRRLRAFLLTTFTLLLLHSGSVFAQDGQADSSPLLLVLNKDGALLSILDANSLKLLGNVGVGDFPHEVLASKDGKLAFVANYGQRTPGTTLSVIDVRARRELRRVDLFPLIRPHGMQEIGGKIYFTAETNRVIVRYDPKTNKVDWVMGTGQNASHMIVGSGDQKRFYTANIASNSVTAFELRSVPPAASRITQIPVGKQPEAIDISPDAKEVWVGLNAENAIDIINTSTRKVVDRIVLGARPYRVRFTPNGKQVYSTLPATKEIVVNDTVTRKELKRIMLESVPLGIVFSKDNKFAFITTVQKDGVIKFDMEKYEVVGEGSAGVAPDGIALAGM